MCLLGVRLSFSRVNPQKWIRQVIPHFPKWVCKFPLPLAVAGGGRFWELCILIKVGDYPLIPFARSRICHTQG